VSPDENADVLYDYVGPNYFSTLGIPLIAGRDFTESDTPTSGKVVIINQTLARKFFAGRNPIGMHIARGSGKPDMEIVGVVGDSKWDTPGSAIVPFLYEPYAQDPLLGQLCFYVRAERDPVALAASLRGVMDRLDPDLPVNDVRTLMEQVNNSMFNYRLVADLSVSLALLAVLLAMLGLYGVLAYVAARRTREIGIRIALGGRPKDILWLVVGQGTGLTAIGGAIGIAAALIATQWLASLLYGVAPRDPLTFVGVGLVLVIVSAGASWIPARRAMRVDPMVALRYE
jgi:putative ABC transport system permease protein